MMHLSLTHHGHKVINWDEPLTFLLLTGAVLIAAIIVGYLANALA